MILQDKMVCGIMLDKICLDYYLPFENNEEILDFLRKDPDLHRRKLALREVFFLLLLFFSVAKLLILFTAHAVMLPSGKGVNLCSQACGHLVP